MDSKTFFSKQYVQVLMTLALVGVIAALSAYAYLTFKQTEGVYTGATSITVIGEGKALAKPDIGVFSFSVLAEGKDAAEAQTKSAESINAVLASLKEAGVEDKDVKTENYYLNPKYSYENTICPMYSYCPPSDPELIGYEVSQTVTVKVRALDKAGDLISKAGEKGATNISSLQFTIDDESAIKSEAREKAIADAKEKAKVLADQLGVKIVRMTSYWEQEGSYYPMMERAYGGDMYSMDSKAVSPEMPIGENEITASVNISYEVR